MYQYPSNGSRIRYGIAKDIIPSEPGDSRKILLLNSPARRIFCLVSIPGQSLGSGFEDDISAQLR